MVSDSRSRFVRLLVATTLGVYALVVAGATTAVSDAAAACTTWPTCGGQWVALGNVDLLVVTTHRAAAAVVGVLVLVTAGLAWRHADRRRVRVALLAAALAYPVQVAVGADIALQVGGPWTRALHLAVGLGIFGACVVALAWTLEDEPTGLPTSDKSGDAPARPDDGPLATVRAYVRMTKPRLMWLLCLVAAAGMALAAGPSLTVRTVALTLGGGVLAIGASGTFNHVLERDVDREMARTADRPLATDRVPPRNAAAFGLLLAAASIGLFLQVNLLAAALGATAIVFYSVVYTLVLKPNTVQNTVIGGFAGSLPALIGAAAVTDSVGAAGLALAALVFVWTPAHFYNLALAYREDYAAGGFPMMPVVRGERVTRKHIMLWLGATLATGAALVTFGPLGALYGATTVAVGGVFLYAAVRLHREHTEQAVFRAFHASNAYLGAVLLAVVVDALVA